MSLRGDTYNMGIVMTYQDGTTSPVYHIRSVRPLFDKILDGLKRSFRKKGPGFMEFTGDDSIPYPLPNSLEKVTHKIFGKKDSIDMMVEYINEIWYDRIPGLKGNILPGQVLSAEHTLQYNEAIKDDITRKILESLKSSKLSCVISDKEWEALSSLQLQQEMTLLYGRV